MKNYDDLIDKASRWPSQRDFSVDPSAARAVGTTGAAGSSVSLTSDASIQQIHRNLGQVVGNTAECLRDSGFPENTLHDIVARAYQR